MCEQSSEDADLADIFSVLKESARGEWDVDADELLLKGLMAFQAKFSARFTSLRDELDGLSGDVSTASIELQNVMNSFLLLSQKQFVQNRVFVDDEDKDNDSVMGTTSEYTENRVGNVSLSEDDALEDVEAKVFRVCQDAVNLAAQIVEERTMPLSLHDMSLDEDVCRANDPQDETGEAFLPCFADHYRQRRFLALIGSKRFLEDPYAGYFDDSDVGSQQSLFDSALNSAPEAVTVDIQQEPVVNGGIVPQAPLAQSKLPPPPSKKLPPPPPPPPPPSKKAAPPPPPPPPASKKTTSPPLAVKATKVATTATQQAGKMNFSALFFSSGSSDESSEDAAVLSRPRPLQNKTATFFGKNDSTFDESSKPAMQKAITQSAVQRKAVIFSDDSTSDSGSSIARPVPSAKMTEKAPTGAMFDGDSSVSSSSEKDLTNSVYKKAAHLSVEPKSEQQKTAVSLELSENNFGNDTAQVSKNLVLPTVSRTGFALSEKITVAQEEEILAPAGSEIKGIVVPPVSFSSETKSRDALGAGLSSLKTLAPLPKRGGKAISTSSSDTEYSFKDKLSLPSASHVTAKNLSQFPLSPSPFSKKVITKTVARPYSSDSDVGTSGGGGVAAPRVPRKVVAKVMLNKYRIDSSDSDG